MTKRSRKWLGQIAAVAALAALVVVATGVGSQSVELQSLRNRGKAMFEELRYAEAVVAFSEVVLDPGADSQDHLNLAAAQYREGNYEASLETLTSGRELLDDHPGSHFLRGVIYRRTGVVDLARPAFEKAREMDPTDPAIRYSLGAVYSQLGLQEEALAEFQVVIDMGFDVALQHYVSALYQQLQMLLREGRRQEAEPAIELYRESSQRLSPVGRAPTALEVSRWTAIVVPDSTLQPANPATAGELGFDVAADIPTASLPDEASVAVADVNLDGRRDWLSTGPDGAVWLSTDSGYETEPLPTPAGAAAIGDFDRDGWPDLYVATPDGDRLFRNVLGDSAGAAAATFEPVAAEGLPAGGAPSGVLWVDFDHDGDLDVLVTHGASADGSAGSPRLLRNQGGGVFLDVTASAGLDDPRRDVGALWADFDSDYDVDLFLWGHDGTALYSNQRGGRFNEVAAAVGAHVGAGTRDAAVEDLDNDGRIDLLLATDDGVVVRRNLAEGTFMPVEVEGLTGLPVDAVDAADFNNDGFLDLVVSVDGGLRFFANAGSFEFVPFEPLPAGEMADPGPPTRFLAASDFDGNGGADVLVEHAGQLRQLVQSQSPGQWLAVDITGIKNNLRGIGANVEVKAGGSYQLRPLRSTPLHFGIGAAAAVDVVRIRWPNGIVQNLLDVSSDQLVTTTELERLEGSCPFLYTWDGQGWHFVNEVLGAAPLGMPLAEGVFHSPDPDEYVFVRGEDLRPVDGTYEIRFTEELRETGYLDAVRVLAVDHPTSLSFLPDENFGGAPRPDFRLFAYDRLLPVRASDQEGRDWSDALAEVDGSWAVPFEPGAYDGLATPHVVTLELREVAPDAEPVNLYLTGWVYWAMGSINLAVDQDPTSEFTPVSLEVPDGNGGWRTAIEDIGLPTAKNTTMIVDVGSVMNRSDPRVRLRTTMRLYWDAAGYTVGGPFPGGLVPAGDWQQDHGVPRPGDLALEAADGSTPPLRVEVLSPTAAELRWRGFSGLSRTEEGYETFDYQTVLASAPWEQHRGFYTAFGDVVDLLRVADDRYVVIAAGDEVAIRFDAPLRPLPAGWRRDYLVYLHGWVKDGDMNTVYGDRVAPLPFHGMSGYPYPPSESYPDDPAHREFLERYLTRPARAINPPLVGRR